MTGVLSAFVLCVLAFVVGRAFGRSDAEAEFAAVLREMNATVGAWERTLGEWDREIRERDQTMRDLRAFGHKPRVGRGGHA